MYVKRSIIELKNYLNRIYLIMCMHNFAYNCLFSVLFAKLLLIGVILHILLSLWTIFGDCKL